MRPLVMDPRTPGTCEVILLPWVALLWFVECPDRFYIFELMLFYCIS